MKSKTVLKESESKNGQSQNLKMSDKRSKHQNE
jgi:hypothetical protein